MNLKIIQGDWIKQLRMLPDCSVQCCVTSPPYWGLRSYLPKGHPLKPLELGQEKTPEEYVAKMVQGFREVRRVLRKDGTCWMNLGDSYEHKDLVGIPWMVAFALRADGWWLRQDIIWSKPNPMPESCQDRCTKAHEYIFLLTKSAHYFYDAEAIKEKSSENTHPRTAGDSWRGSQFHTGKTAEHQLGRASKNRKLGLRSGGVKSNASFDAALSEMVTARNKRSVWTIASAPYKKAHFATFPPALIKPCILAGTSGFGCCSKCGAPFERIVKDGAPDLAHRAACGADPSGGYSGKATKDYASAKCQDPSAVKARILAGMVEKKTIGWRPTCDCAGEPVPCTVLDPFGGSGTTGEVALELGRQAILIELNPEYHPLIEERTFITPGLALA